MFKYLMLCGALLAVGGGGWFFLESMGVIAVQQPNREVLSNQKPEALGVVVQDQSMKPLLIDNETSRVTENRLSIPDEMQLLEGEISFEGTELDNGVVEDEALMNTEAAIYANQGPVPLQQGDNAAIAQQWQRHTDISRSSNTDSYIEEESVRDSNSSNTVVYLSPSLVSSRVLPSSAGNDDEVTDEQSGASAYDYELPVDLESSEVIVTDMSVRMVD